MMNFSKNQIYIIIIISMVVVCVISYYIFQRIQDTQYEEVNVNEILAQEDTKNVLREENIVVEEENSIIIHIVGSVKKNGIIEAKEGDRVSDIISLAGGLTEEADISDVNLAYKVEDGQKIYIPSIKEKNVLGHYITTESGEGIIEQTELENKIVVNINTANQTELETLPGVGPSTATNIMKYREENGKYQTIEDIKNVPGIGDIKFESLKEYIKVK